MSGVGYSETSKLAGDCHGRDSGGQRLQSRSARNFWNKAGMDKHAWLNEGVMLSNEGRRLTFSSLQVLLLPQDTTILPFTWCGNLITVVGRGERVQEGINLTFVEGANFYFDY